MTPGRRGSHRIPVREHPHRSSSKGRSTEHLAPRLADSAMSNPIREEEHIPQQIVVTAMSSQQNAASCVTYHPCASPLTRICGELRIRLISQRRLFTVVLPEPVVQHYFIPHAPLLRDGIGVTTLVAVGSPAIHPRDRPRHPVRHDAALGKPLRHTDHRRRIQAARELRPYIGRPSEPLPNWSMKSPRKFSSLSLLLTAEAPPAPARTPPGPSTRAPSESPPPPPKQRRGRHRPDPGVHRPVRRRIAHGDHLNQGLDA